MGCISSSRGTSWHRKIKPTSLMSPALAGGLFTTRATWEALSRMAWYKAHKTRMLCSYRVQEGRTWKTPSFLSPPLQPQALASPMCVCLCACLVTQSCLTLCHTRDCSPPSSSVHGVIQARILEHVAISSSRGSSWPRDQTCVSCIGRQILYHRATWEDASPISPS